MICVDTLVLSPFCRYIVIALCWCVNCEVVGSFIYSTQILWLLISWMQDYYPERLGKLFILHAPYIFMKVWKIVYPFIDNKTKKKVMFLIKLYISHCMVFLYFSLCLRCVEGKYFIR